ncbi:YbeD family protein [Candidatus Rariloculus sp.]|uniref:YbeD family protein n=1 Tax=Candidatus Rariloculus sp. TaxID=3101265 RepID=UPI003D0F48BC
MSDESLLTFPCEIDIKVIGRRTTSLRATVLGIVRAHCGVVEDSRVRERHSSEGNYLSMSVTVLAETREQIDAVYRELTASDQVLMAL